MAALRVENLVVPGNGLEPSSLAAADFKSAVFTNFTTRAGSPRASPRTAAAGRGARPGFGSRAVLGQLQPGVHHRVGIQGNALDALVHQPLGKIRVIRGTLAANADVFAEAVAGADCHG